jgi:DtxR family Mn-dependent transcriptional regulator
MLGNPTVDPHGDPIPTSTGDIAPTEQSSLLSCPLQTRLHVTRVQDQSTDFLQLVDRRGLRPGQTVRVLARDEAADTVDIEVAGTERLNLGFRAASKILVEPSP